MKTKKISKLLFCLPLLAMLWGCASESENDFPDSAYPLLLSAEVEDMSAPVLRSTANIGDAGISISGGTTYSNAKYNGTGGTLTPATQGYWGSTSNISIYGYAPYQAIAPTSVAVKTDQSVDADYTASDFLYASPATFTFANRNAMSLTFKHHLSKINFTLVAGDGVSATELATANVQITGTNTKATIAIATGSLTALSDVAAIITHSEEAKKYKAIVIPQTLAAGTSLFEVTIGASSFDYTLPAAQTFEQGKQYNYTLTVSQGGITVSPVEITQWEEEVIDNSGISDRIYRLGDYYPDPNVNLTNAEEKAKIQGVVFWIDPTSKNRHGKIMSLEEGTSLQWDAAKTWCTNKNGDWRLPSKDELQHLYCAYNGALPITWYSYTTGAPTIDATARVIFNGKLTAADGIALTSGWYWSSLVSTGKPWFVGFSNGHTYTIGKTSAANVRAVLAF